MKDIEKTIAQAVRIEYNQYTSELFLVFQVVDESFKRRIQKDWMEDVPVRIIGKRLYLKE
jgi:hypothetical protein